MRKSRLSKSSSEGSRFPFWAAARLKKGTWNLSVLIFLLSWATVRAGVYLGHHSGVTGDGYPKPGQLSEDLFRFDSYYYLDIAEQGYSYSGDPGRSPNLVFAPVFPLLTEALAYLPGLDLVSAGFLLNKIFLFGAILLLFSTLTASMSQWRAFAVLAALTTAAGSYSLHAYYSESTMLFFLALTLFAYQRGWHVTLALAACALGASRWTGAAMAGVWCVWFFWRGGAWRRSVPLGLLCIAGALAQMLFLAARFGNPFTLLPQIQSVSWGRFHHPVAWSDILTSLFSDWAEVPGRGLANWYDIKTLNLIWMSLAALAVIVLLTKSRRSIYTWLFGVYFGFIYVQSVSSDYLISSHRFFVLMLPIFMMFADLHDWVARKTSRAVAYGLSGILLTINLAYGIVHAAYFNQGIWFYF